MGVNQSQAASTTADLNFGGSGPSDILGNVVNLTALKELFVFAYCANTNNVIIANGASNGLVIMGGTAPTVSLVPCGRLDLTWPTAGLTVSSSHKTISFGNSSSGTAVNYDVILVGI